MHVLIVLHIKTLVRKQEFPTHGIFGNNFNANLQSLAIPHIALTDLQHQIEQQQNKTDREMAALENTITDGKNTTTQMN